MTLSGLQSSVNEMIEKTPQCIGIILDGNRRWAKEKGMPSLQGHRKGLDCLIDCIKWVRDRKIKNLAVFLFSTENWEREAPEVSYLMDLFREAVKKQLREIGKENVRVRFVGQRERFSEDLQGLMKEIEGETEKNDGLTLWACLSYGGRAEITAAAKKIAASGEEITEESLRGNFWSAGMPDLDILIRTGGEKRVSNFLLWQAAYAELFFVDEYWPDFSESILDSILMQYATRERRMGK